MRKYGPRCPFVPVRVGQHQAIIDEATYNAALVGTRGRFRPGQRAKPHRVYLLKGVITCANGHLMHGECRVSRGQEWRYYLCRMCDAPSVPADAAEEIVIDAISQMTLPPSVIDQARTELARRLDVPATDVMGTKRRRLEGRLNRLTQLYSWGELEADEYRRQMNETRAMLAELPDPDKLIAFDRNRRIMVSMAENVEKATRPQLQELVQLLVERVQAKGCSVDPASIEWTPPAKPFFGEVRCYGAPGRTRGLRKQSLGPPRLVRALRVRGSSPSPLAHQPPASRATDARSWPPARLV